MRQAALDGDGRFMRRKNGADWIPIGHITDRMFSYRNDPEIKRGDRSAFREAFKRLVQWAIAEGLITMPEQPY